MQTFRVASYDTTDFLPVFELCKEAAIAVNGEYHEEYLFKAVESFFQDDYNNRVLLLAYDEETPVGALGAVRVPDHFLYGDTLAIELVFWITPSYRKTRIFLKLIKAYENWAKQVGITQLVLSDIHDNESLRKAYVKKGYHKSETSFIKKMEIN